MSTASSQLIWTPAPAQVLPFCLENSLLSYMVPTPCRTRKEELQHLLSCVQSVKRGTSSGTLSMFCR